LLGDGSDRSSFVEVRPSPSPVATAMAGSAISDNLEKRTKKEKAVTKAELGVKRRCLSCSAAFFDLNREPIVCPKCNAVFQVVELPHSAPRRAPYRPIPSDALVGDGQASSDGEVSSVETDAEADGDESDDSVPQPIEEDEKIEDIDDLM